jgi:hypothetical protein
LNQPPAAGRIGGQIVPPGFTKGDIRFVTADHRYSPARRPGDHTGPPDPRVDWWADTIDRINTWWVNRQPVRPAIQNWAQATPRPVVITAATLVTAIALAAVTVVVWLASALYGLVTAAATDGRHTGAAGVRWSAAWRLTHTITDPVHAYLTGHAAALHTSGGLLWTGWLATTAVLFVFAVAGSTGARIGWTATGALTTAVVYIASPADARPLAAGIAITAWSLLSIAAFNRITVSRRGPDITIVHASATSTTDNDDRTDPSIDPDVGSTGR